MSDKVTSTSTQQVVTALISNLVVFSAFVSGFLLLRLKLKRIYEPKSSYDLINDEKKPEPLPNGLWQWFMPLMKNSDNFVIQQAGLDGYFFLRYLFIICAYCSVSIIYIFPILIPINAANGNHETGLNQIAYQNVKHRRRYYAHVFIGWIFFWSFLYVVYRELYFYTSMRQAVLSSPRYARKLSSRTVLFQTVPTQYLSEEEFSKLFDGVKRVWIARGAKEIEKLVKERDALAYQLENAESGYLSAAIKKVKKMQKKSPELTVSPRIEDYLTPKDRPRHALKFWHKLIFRKVDTLNYLKEEIPKINKKIEELQEDHANAPPFNSVFVEFESQYQAQVAAQVTTYHAPLFMTPAYIGIEPSDVVWFNLRMFWWERLVREVTSIISICAVVILWSIPVAFVGLISNITYLTNKLHWLRFIYKLPNVLLGILTAMAPTIALSVLMMCLPIFIRTMAKLQGSPSSQRIEHFTQNAFFAFQVVQVFLVTTLSSAATSAVTQIVANPSSAMNILASNLPKASNFFIAYIVLQGMSISSSSLLQLVPLILFYLLGALLDSTSRKKWTRFTNLSSMSWGTTFPVYTGLSVIIFSYAIISPIILLFGAAGFFLLYVAYLYTLTYVYKEAPDSRGMHYPRALFQTIVGLYIGQICLLGLFAVGKGWGPIVLQAIGLGVTVIIHLYLNKAFDRLMKVIPVDTMKALDGKADTPSFKNIYSVVNGKDDIKELPQFPIRKYQPHGSQPGKSDIRSSGGFSGTFSENTVEYHYEVPCDTENSLSTVSLLADGDETRIPPAPFYKRFFQPHIYCSYKAVKSRLPEIYNLVDPSEKLDENSIAHAYNYPAVSAKCPFLWIPKDPYGFSKEIIRDLDGIIDISDENSTIDKDAKIVITGNPPSYESIQERQVEEDTWSYDPFKDPLMEEDSTKSPL